MNTCKIQEQAHMSLVHGQINDFAHANHISNTQNHQTGNQDIMIKQRKRNTTFLLKLMPLAPNNSKWMPLAISRKRKSIITANKEHSSLLSSNTQTTLM